MKVTSKRRSVSIFRGYLAFLMAIAALSVSSNLWAQDAGQTDAETATPADAEMVNGQPAASPVEASKSVETSKVTEMPEVVVRGRAEDILGVAVGASAGAIGEEDLKDLPLLRRGEIMETVPGLVVTQHSGDGKANQYFLRGFNLDHGTDFAFSVDDVPVNLPSHAHGQGYSDLNFMIPELVSFIEYRKGPFYSEVGDFSGSGASNVHLVEQPPARHPQPTGRHVWIPARLVGGVTDRRPRNLALRP